MANPNKTVLNARRKIGGFPTRDPKPVDEFTEWLCAQARSGASFSTLEDAKQEFDKSKEGK
jgi:hypothetical protein